MRQGSVTSAPSSHMLTTELQLGDNRRDLVLKDRNCSGIQLRVALASHEADYFPYLLQPVANVIANACLDCPLTFVDQTMLSATLQEPGAREPGIPPPPPASVAGTLRLLWQRTMKGHATFMEKWQISCMRKHLPPP